MTEGKIKINRAPVLTLWAAVVAERLGFDREEVLSLGKAVAGLTAQSKGRRLGQFRPEIPEGVRGWGAKGELDLGRVRTLPTNAA